MLEKKAPSSDAVIFEKKKRGMEPLVLMLSLTGHLIRSTAVAKDTAGQPLLEALMGSTKLLSLSTALRLFRSPWTCDAPLLPGDELLGSHSHYHVDHVHRYLCVEIERDTQRLTVAVT